MEHVTSTSTAFSAAEQKKSKDAFLLLLIAMVGIVGLIYVLSASYGKTGFSEKQPAPIEQIAEQV